MTISAHDQDEALRTAKLLERAIQRISEFKFPELIAIEVDNEDLDEDDDDYEDDAWSKFECPWCHRAEYIEAYKAISVQTLDSPISEPNDSSETTFQVIYEDADDERTDLYLECSYCRNPVSLPSEYDLTAY